MLVLLKRVKFGYKNVAHYFYIFHHYLNYLEALQLTAKFCQLFCSPNNCFSHVHYHTKIILESFEFHILQIMLKKPRHFKKIVATELLVRISLNVQQ